MAEDQSKLLAEIRDAIQQYLELYKVEIDRRQVASDKYNEYLDRSILIQEKTQADNAHSQAEYRASLAPKGMVPARWQTFVCVIIVAICYLIVWLSVRNS